MTVRPSFAALLLLTPLAAQHRVSNSCTFPISSPVMKTGSSPKSVIEVEVSFMQRLAWEVGVVNPRFI